MYVNPTEFWLLEFAKINDKSDLAVPISEGGFVTASFGAVYSGWYNGDKGKIVKPSGTNLWPSAS